MLVDSHCHLADPTYDVDRADVLRRAWTAGVGGIIVIGESRQAAERALALVQDDPRLAATAGLHPHESSAWSEEYAAWLGQALRSGRVVAVGETGLDYHYNHSPRDVQRTAFDAQLALARAVGKPAVVHAREADDDVVAVLRNHPRATVILHSFSSGLGLLRAAVALGHYVSFSGMVTFKSWQLDDAIRETPPDRLLLETDAPYLAPVPHRGKRNEPGYVAHVAERVAQVLGRDVDDVIASTGANALRVFGLRREPAAASDPR